jgi:hypothetical protein
MCAHSHFFPAAAVIRRKAYTKLPPRFMSTNVNAEYTFATGVAQVLSELSPLN